MAVNNDAHTKKQNRVFEITLSIKFFLNNKNNYYFCSKARSHYFSQVHQNVEVFVYTERLKDLNECFHAKQEKKNK